VVRGRLVVLSGPSGVGKDTVIQAVRRRLPDLQRPVAYTTRAPRPGEEDGREYSFVTSEEFERLRERGEFLETARVHGNLYGTSRQRVEELRQSGRDVLLKIDVQGAAQLHADQPDATFIFLAPPSREVLLARLRERATESPAELARRTEDADRELAQAGWYHHLVVNDEVEQAAEEVVRILQRDR
jgi:guanylate kinase